MTDDELKALVASVAIAQKETGKQMELFAKENNERMKQADERMKHTDEQLKLTAEQLKRTDEQLKRTDEKLERTDKKLERIGITLGNMGRNQGEVAEEFFYNSLAQDNHLGGIHFDEITKNLSKHRGSIQEEYDLVMANGNAVAIVEVKYKAHQDDLNKLDRKMRHFKQLFPMYQAFKQYGAIAAFHIHDDAKTEAIKRGYFVLQRSGKVIRSESGDTLTVL
ncbi:MAG: hypothetical protein WAX77_09690 [Methylococcaceae bacterium]